MNAETAAILREPFDPKYIGKLPRVTCRDCRDSKSRNCQQHQKSRCRDCGNYITTAHLHLDYVGHAEITDRLLKADPTWTWEPVAFGPDGLPLLDRNGGLWIRLTVAGVTRLGYGHADGKSGPDAIKEAIGDALRNAAMRFGVALDLWGATFKEGGDEHDEPAAVQQSSRPQPAPQAAEQRPEPTSASIRDWTLSADRTGDEVRQAVTRVLKQYPALAAERVTNEHGDEEQLSVLMTRRAKELEPPGPAELSAHDERRRKRMFALLGELGYSGREQYHQVFAHVLKRDVATSKDLTSAEVEDVIAALELRQRQLRNQREAVPA